MDGEVASSSTTLGEARDRVNRLIDVSERVIHLTAQSSLNSVDGPFIGKVQEVAAAVTSAFEAALREGRITGAQPFDRAYKAIADTEGKRVVWGRGVTVV